MAKSLKDILAGTNKSKKEKGSTGIQPGVDYAPKSAGDQSFVSDHEVKKYADRAGNGDDVYNATNIKRDMSVNHGHIPRPKDLKAYKKMNEEKEETLSEEQTHRVEISFSKDKTASTKSSKIVRVPAVSKTAALNRAAASVAAQGYKIHGISYKGVVHQNEKLNEAMRLVKIHTNDDKTKVAKVYKDNEWNEYRVKHFDNGKHLKNADYHTTDLDDAHDTAKQFFKEEKKKKKVKESQVPERFPSGNPGDGKAAYNI